MKKTIIIGFCLALGLALMATVALAWGPGTLSHGATSAGRGGDAWGSFHEVFDDGSGSWLADRGPSCRRPLNTTHGR